MELPQALLDILVCPETKEAVAPAPADLLTRINSSIERGEVMSRQGEKLTKPLEAALLRADGRRLYPIYDGIPVMLLDEAVDL